MMGKDFAFWGLLLLITCALAHGARQMNGKQHSMEEMMGGHSNVLRLPSLDKNHAKKENDHVPEPSYFFNMEDLKPGNKMPVYLPTIHPSSSPPMLSREIAESIPFSYEAYPHILQLFNVSENSSKARELEVTLKKCGEKPGKGETKLCATSLESMLDFVQGCLGAESKFHPLVTKHLTGSKSIFQDYTVTKLTGEVPTSNWVSCHLMHYLYAIYFCHRQTSSKAFKVSLEGENGDQIEAAAACHMDTSAWDPSSLAFKVLGAKPGSVVCHFFPEKDLTWVPHVPV